MSRRLLTFQGKTCTLAEWSRSLGGTQQVVGMRLRNGWTLERALTEPLKPVGPRLLYTGTSKCLDCESRAEARHLCYRHYNTRRKAGTLPPVQRKSHSLSRINVQRRRAFCSDCMQRVSITKAGKAGKAGKAVKAGKAATITTKAAKLARWLRIITPLKNRIPGLGFVPTWTPSVWFELKS